MTLNWPSSQGGLHAVEYAPVTVAQYNAAVTEIQGQAQTLVNQDVQRRVQQNAKSADLDEIRRQNQTVNNSLDDVAAELRRTNGLVRDVQQQLQGLSGAKKVFGDSLELMKKDQSTLLKDAQIAQSCFDVKSVQNFDLNVLTGFDLSQITGYDTNNLVAEVSHTQQLMKSLADVAQRLAEAPERVASVRQANPRSTVTVSAAWRTTLNTAQDAAVTGEQQLQAAVTQAQAVRTTTLDQARQLVAQAQDVAMALHCQR